MHRPSGTLATERSSKDGRAEPARAASTSAAPRSRRSSSTSRNKVLGEARRPDAAHGGPPPSPRRWPRRCARPPSRPAGPGYARRSRCRLAGRDRRRAPASVSQARNLPELGRQLPARARTLADESRGQPVKSATTSTSRPTPSSRSAPARSSRRLLGVFWGTGVGGGLVLDGEPWLGRGAAAEIGHVVVRRDGAQCPCGRRGCMEAYAGRAMMEARARKRMTTGEKTDLFKIMEKRGRTRELTSGVWERALDQGDKLADRPDRPRDQRPRRGVASACNLLDVEAVVLGGGLGVRLGDRYLDDFRPRRSVAPLRRRRPARDLNRRARGPRRRDRRVAARQADPPRRGAGDRRQARRRLGRVPLPDHGRLALPAERRERRRLEPSAAPRSAAAPPSARRARAGSGRGRTRARRRRSCGGGR